MPRPGRPGVYGKEAEAPSQTEMGSGSEHQAGDADG